MNKTTPMILVAMLMLSLMANFDLTEMQENIDVDNTSARAGADADVIAITSPKETTCTNAGCRNTLNAGETTNFEAYIQNSGDVDITELSYTVGVWLSDGNGNPVMLARDPAGNDLEWQNTNVICFSQCDFQSLTASDVLGGGKYTLLYQGIPIVWTPTVGNYIIQVVVDTPNDADPGNDAQTIEVNVIDWYDLQVDLSWDVAGEETETGSGPKGWSLSVIATGSNTFTPREVTVQIKGFGDITELQSNDGTDLLTDAFYNVAVGTSTLVETYSDESTEPPTPTNSNRMVLSYQTEWTFGGELTFDASNADASYGLEAKLINYTQYGQFESCATTDPATNETVFNWCEEEFTQDSYPGTNDDEILGYSKTYHDIRISRMTVAQGYDANGLGNPTSMVTDDAPRDLNVGVSYLHVEVEHRGSDIAVLYDWNVTLTVTDAMGTANTVVANSCVDGVEPLYTYTPLGDGEVYDENGDPMGQALPTGYACMMVTLDSGEHTFEAVLTLEQKTTDARPSNNDRSMTVDVRNNNPLILSIGLTNEGELFTGQEQPLQMFAEVFDVDDPAGSSLEFSWSHNGSEFLGCERSNQSLTCDVFIEESYVTDFPVSFTVYDANGGSANQELMLQIWNNGGGSATTASGISVTYNIKYNAPGQFSVTSVDADLADYADQILPDYSGTYSAVGAVDYAPGTTYSAGDILEHSMEVTVPKDIDATSLWYVTDAGNWRLISSEAVDVDASTEMFEYEIPSDVGVLPRGTLVLFGGALALESVPDASINPFTAVATKGGAISLNWGIAGTMLPSDSIDITICEGEAGCADAFATGLGVGVTTFSYSGSNTEHGAFYSVVVEICNSVGCSTPKGIANVTADKSVDGDVSAIELSVSESGEMWIIDWEAKGETSDVASWNVCYQRGTFNAANMPNTCASTTSSTTGVEIDKPNGAGTYTYYFTAVPVDALGNTAAAGSLNSIDYQRDADTSNADDGLNVTDGGDKASSEVPSWTWGLIGGVVLVAFIAGAFILSRGGEGDEGKENWDY